MRAFLAFNPVVALFSLSVVLGLSECQAANFLSAFYDARTDELVVTLSYRGTNPDHEFTVAWGDCHGEDGMNEIAGRIIDSQWNDRALESFTKAVRFDLAQLRCRPARITLVTAPNFRIGVTIPAAAGNSQRSLRGPRTDTH
jgi:hypothetical protein